MSDKLMIFLAIEYAVLAGASAAEMNWGRCVYFIGATIISIGVLMSTR